MTSSLLNTTTNVGTKPVDNQIETVPLADAPALIIANIPTSTAWFEAHDTQQSEMMKTESNKTIEADPINNASLCILYSQ
ncbi:25200_t:CDS:2, partial [Gigaspora rosea]